MLSPCFTEMNEETFKRLPGSTSEEPFDDCLCVLLRQQGCTPGGDHAGIFVWFLAHLGRVARTLCHCWVLHVWSVLTTLVTPPPSWPPMFLARINYVELALNISSHDEGIQCVYDTWLTLNHFTVYNVTANKHLYNHIPRIHHSEPRTNALPL